MSLQSFPSDRVALRLPGCEYFLDPKEPVAEPAAPNRPSEPRQLSVRSLSLFFPCGKNLFLLKQMV